MATRRTNMGPARRTAGFGLRSLFCSFLSVYLDFALNVFIHCRFFPLQVSAGG